MLEEAERHHEDDRNPEDQVVVGQHRPRPVVVDREDVGLEVKGELRYEARGACGSACHPVEVVGDDLDDLAEPQGHDRQVIPA